MSLHQKEDRPEILNQNQTNIMSDENHLSHFSLNIFSSLRMLPPALPIAVPRKNVLLFKPATRIVRAPPPPSLHLVTAISHVPDSSVDRECSSNTAFTQSRQFPIMHLRRLAGRSINRLARLDCLTEVWRSVGIPVDLLCCRITIAITRTRRVRRSVIDVPSLLAVGRREEANNKSV